MKNSIGEKEAGMIISTLSFLQKSMGLSWTENRIFVCRIQILVLPFSFFSRKFKLPPKAGGKSYLLKAIFL